MSERMSRHKLLQNKSPLKAGESSGGAGGFPCYPELRNTSRAGAFGAQMPARIRRGGSVAGGSKDL